MDLKEFIMKVSEKLRKTKAGILIRINICEINLTRFIYEPNKSKEFLEDFEEILRKNIRETDLITRTRENEFTIFIELSKEENISTVVERIYTVFVHFLKDTEIFINAGVSIFPIDGKTFEELFEKAGHALNEAVKTGPNVIKFYSQTLVKDISETLKAEVLIERAINEKLFEFYYHPIFDARNLKVFALEVLIRIVEKDGTIYPAKDFIYFLEKHPYMDVLEEKLIKKAIENSRKWGVPIAINLSEAGFLTGSFLKKLAKQCIPECRIIVEVTERIFVKTPAICIEVLNKLKEAGVEVAVDDFGVGYSLLAYLKDLPFDILKIDRSFIKELPNNMRARSIVEVMVNLGKKLKIKICAEGVENEEQLSFLRSVGCDYVQGFLFGEPIPEEEVEKKYIDLN